MEQTAADVLYWLEKAQRMMDDLVRQTAAPEQRVSQVTEALRSLVPGASLYLCALRLPNASAVAAVDALGQAQAEVASQLSKALAGTENSIGPCTDQFLAEMPQCAGQVRVVEPIDGRNHHYGALAVAVPPKAAVEAEPRLRALLPLFTARLAAQLTLEVLEQELRGQTAKADIGEVAAPVAHELNNWLNALLLHVAVLEQEVPAGCRAELNQVRRQSKQLASLIKEWQQYRQAQHAGAATLRLNELVREAVSAPSASEGSKLILKQGLPHLHVSPVDVKRLLRFLLNQMRPLIPGGKCLTLRTDATPGHVVLRLELDGPSNLVKKLADKLDLAADQEERDRLEMAACDTLVRRMQGKLRVEKGQESGVAVVVELPAAAKS